jgi:hypothetical protein
MPRAKKPTAEQIRLNEIKLWTKIREEFETEGAGVRELGRRHEVSHTTISRRAAAEHWLRDEKAMTAHFATQQVIQSLDDKAAPGAETGANQVVVHQGKNPTDAEKTVDSENHAPVAGGGASDDPEQGRAIASAQRTAKVQAQQLEREIELADGAIELAAGLMDVLREVLAEPDISRAMMLTRKFQGPTESFSGLMKSAIGTLEKAVSIRRRALGLNPGYSYGEKASGGQIHNPLSAEDLPQRVRSILPTMSTEELMKMREASVLMNRRIDSGAGRPVIDIDFEEGSTKGG